MALAMFSLSLPRVQMCERLFSASGRTISKLRTRLAPDLAEAQTMLYFWLRSDDLAEDHTSVDMLSVPVGPVDVLPPDVPVLVLAAVGPTGIVTPGGGAGVRAPAVAAAVIGDGAVAIAAAVATYCC